MKSDIKSKKPDFVYGDSVKATWNELAERYGIGNPFNVGTQAGMDAPNDEASITHENAQYNSDLSQANLRKLRLQFLASEP